VSGGCDEFVGQHTDLANDPNASEDGRTFVSRNIEGEYGRDRPCAFATATAREVP
jgi:hypothetical protein